MRHVLAIDEGTTGVTCLVVAEDGRVVGRGYREITQYYPQPGWVEHDADEIVRHTVDASREAIASAGVTPHAIGITNQRETVVVWDRETGRPLHRAIVWQDRRTARRCAELASSAEFLTTRTGLVVDPYFSATKLEWLLTRGRLLERHRPEQLAAGTIDSWLVWQLTRGAVHVTDPTNASRTMLFDIDAMKWSVELCALFGVPASMLPEVPPSSGRFGVTDGKAFGAEISILGVAGDQQAALYGQGGDGSARAVAPIERRRLFRAGARRARRAELGTARAGRSSRSPAGRDAHTSRGRRWRRWHTARTTTSSRRPRSVRRDSPASQRESGRPRRAFSRRASSRRSDPVPGRQSLATGWPAGPALCVRH